MSPQKTTYELAMKCVQRAESLGLKKAKADAMAMEFFVGAACLAETSPGREALAGHLKRIIVLVVSIRGMFGVREMIADYQRSNEFKAEQTAKTETAPA